MKKALMILGALVLICGGGFFLMTTLGIMGLGGAIDEAKNAPGGTRESAFAVGAEVAVGDLAYTILEAKDAGPTLKATDGFSGDTAADGGGTFIVVRYTVKNNGKSGASLNKFILEDDQARTFGQTVTFGDYVPKEEHCTLEMMNAGLSETCQDIFQVPADATGLMAKIDDSLGFKFVDLALAK